jgi:TP901 family phage tail tape measure protein
MAIELGSAYGKVTLDANGVKQGARQAQDSLSQLDKTVQDVFKFSMGNLAAQGIGKLIGGMSDLYGETKALTTGFESQMAIMSTAVDPATASMDTLHDAAMAVGGDISLVGIDAQQASASMTDLFKSGKSVSDVFGDLEGYMAGNVQLGGILRASVDLQAASMLDLDGATALVNSTMSTYGLTAQDAVRITDNFVKTADASQAEVEDLAMAHQNAAIVLASFGYTLEDTNTALALLSENALKGAEAGTSLRAMINNMLRPTNKTADAWNELNISLYDSEGQLKKMPQLIGELVPALQNVTTERRNELVYLLAGADGQRALNILLSKGTDGWQAMEQAIAGASSAQEVAAARAATLQGAQEALQGTLDTLKIQVGEEFIPVWTRMTQGLTAFYDEHGPQIVAMAGKIADGITSVMDALEGLDPALVKSLAQLGTVATVAGGGYLAFVKLAPVVGALGPVFNSAVAGMQLYAGGASVAEVASLGLSAALGPIVVGLAAVAASVYAVNKAIQLHNEIVEKTAEIEGKWSDKLADIASSTDSADAAAAEYVETQAAINRTIDEGNPIAAMFIDRQKMANASTEELHAMLLASSTSYEDYRAAIQRVNEAVAEQSTRMNWLGAEVVDTNALIENSVWAVDELTYAAEKNALSSEGAAAGTKLYSSALMDAVGATAMALTSTEGLIAEQVAAAESAEEMAALYDGLSKALSNTGLSQSAMTRAQGELAAQMGYTTRLANMQTSAMNLLAYEHAQGNISLEQYIAAGQQVQAIHEDSLSGYQAVANAVAYATGKYGGLSAATADLPGAMHDAAMAAQETAAAQEEMAQRAKAAWETFAGNVQTGVANALEAYKSGNVKMLAEQQRALGEMLWTQTDQMQGMGQITNDQAMEMKSALAGEFGIVVDDVRLATDELLRLFNDWATGGQTSADQVVAFIQNIGTESATLKANAEADIQAQITAWQNLQTNTETSSAEVARLMREMGLTVDEQGNLVEAALGEAGGAAGTMAGDVEGAAGRATTAIGGIATAIENLPEYKKIEIEIVKTGDEAFNFNSPDFRFYYALERLVDYADTHPVEIDIASRMDGGMALDASAMMLLAPVAAPTPVSGGMYDQRQYNNVTMPVTAVQDALDMERLAQRVVALLRSRQ